MSLFFVIFFLFFLWDVGGIIEERLFAVGVEFKTLGDLEVGVDADEHGRGEGQPDEVDVGEPVPILREDQKTGHCLQFGDARFGGQGDVHVTTSNIQKTDREDGSKFGHLVALGFHEGLFYGFSEICQSGLGLVGGDLKKQGEGNVGSLSDKINRVGQVRPDQLQGLFGGFGADSQSHDAPIADVGVIGVEQHFDDTDEFLVLVKDETKCKDGSPFNLI